MIKGSNVYLRLTEKYDLNIIMDMYKDTLQDKSTYNKHKKFIYEHFTEIRRSPLTCLSIINNKNVIVGFVTYIEQDNGYYKLGITIGKRFRNRGYAKETINLLADDLFLLHSVHGITLEVQEDNEAAIACYRECGFIINSDSKYTGIKENIMYMYLLNPSYEHYGEKCS